MHSPARTSAPPARAPLGVVTRQVAVNRCASTNQQGPSAKPKILLSNTKQRPPSRILLVSLQDQENRIYPDFSFDKRPGPQSLLLRRVQPPVALQAPRAAPSVQAQAVQDHVVQDHVVQDHVQDHAVQDHVVQDHAVQAHAVQAHAVQDYVQDHAVQAQADLQAQAEAQEAVRQLQRAEACETGSSQPAADSVDPHTQQIQESTLNSIQQIILSHRSISTQSRSVAGTHQQPREYYCRQCDRRFTHQNLLTMHLKNAHPISKSYRCSQCEKSYVFPDGLESHIRMVHNGERPFSCNNCGKVFSRREYLQAHTRAHSGVRPYVCYRCPRTYTWKGCLEVHVRTHTGEKPYVCLTCLREFSTSGNLRMHSLVHEGLYPFPCTLCPKRFRARNKLKLHMAIHSLDDSLASDVELPDSACTPIPAPAQSLPSLDTPPLGDRPESSASSPLATPLSPPWN